MAKVLKAGCGRVYVRDYAEGDLAQQRFSASSRPQQLSHGFYVRMDGTRAYYFTEAGAQPAPSSSHMSCDALQHVSPAAKLTMQL